MRGFVVSASGKYPVFQCTLPASLLISDSSFLLIHARKLVGTISSFGVFFLKRFPAGVRVFYLM
jgi:hypothetical protein